MRLRRVPTGTGHFREGTAARGILVALVATSDLIQAIRDEAAGLADAADLGLNAPVPRYSGWTLADLVCHTGDIHRWVTEMIEQRALDRVPRAALGSHLDPTALTSWFADGARRLADVLATTDPAVAVWTLSDEGTVDFWRTRMAHETTIHRWDAQSAHGEAKPIASWLARSGISESVVRHLPTRGIQIGGSGERLHLHCLDELGDWIVTLLPTELRVDAGSAPHAVDATVAANASDLWLLLGGRSFGAQLRVTGDRSVLERFEAALQMATVPQLP